MSQLPPPTSSPPVGSNDGSVLVTPKPRCPADRALMTNEVYPWQPGLKHYFGCQPTITSGSNFTEGCHAQILMPVMEIDVAGSAEQNGYFCAVTLTELNSWLGTLTATKESPAWLKSERTVHRRNAAWDIMMPRSGCRDP